MLKKILGMTLIPALLAGPVLAGGDAAKGEKTFRKCKSCHSILADDGTVIVKGGKTGPNLYGLPGRALAGDPNYTKYSKGLKALGEQGLTWNEELFLAWVSNPTGFLKERTGDSKARSKMSLKLRKGGEDIWAYLVSVSPAAE